MNITLSIISLACAFAAGWCAAVKDWPFLAGFLVFAILPIIIQHSKSEDEE